MAKQEFSLHPLTSLSSDSLSTLKTHYIHILPKLTSILLSE